MNGMLMASWIVLMAAMLPADENWPQWRGGSWDSLSPATGLPEALIEETLIWSLELPGPGGASPVVWGDRIFLSSVDGSKVALLCINTDGNLLWQRDLAGKNQRIRMDNANSASPSPVADASHVWVMKTDGLLHCFTHAGDLVWKKDLQEEYGRFNIQFGMTSTPLLDRGMLYLQLIHGDMRDKSSSIGKIVALDASDGSQRWVHVRETAATVENKHAYTSPLLFRNADRQFLIVHGADATTGHRLEDGQELWRVIGLNPKSGYNPFLRFVSSPVCNEDLIVVPSAKSGPVIGISPDLSGSVSLDSHWIKWKLDRGTPDVATPVISNKLVYLARENGVFVCVDAETGTMLYEERILRDKHRSTPVVADGRIYLVGRDGTALVLGEGREFRLISEYDLEEDTTASPAIADGKIYVRTNKSLFAFAKSKIK